MKISTTATHTVRLRQSSWVFVRVRTDSGIEGLGELNPSAEREGCLRELARLGAEIQGEDPADDQLTQRLGAQRDERLELLALAAIDQALWDIRGRAQGMPICELLGGSRRTAVPVYANVTRATTALEPAEFTRTARGAIGDGFSIVKIAPFSAKNGMITDLTQAREGIEIVHAVREEIGCEAELMLDCYGIFSEAAALQLTRELRGVDLYWFEEPVADSDAHGYRAVKDASGYRIAGGERLQRLADFRRMFTDHQPDVVMPDVTIATGIGEVKRIAEAALEHGIDTAPHGPFGPLCVAAGVQVMASHPGRALLEYAWNEVPWRARLTMPEELLRGGEIAVPDTPGIGLGLDEAALAEHA